MQANSGHEIVGKVEHPFDNMKLYGNELLVGGWAFAKDGDDIGINISVDGDSLGRGKWGLARYDVYKHYQTEASYESGYFVKIYTNSLSSGRHKLDVLAEYKNREYIINSVNLVKINKKYEKLAFLDIIKNQIARNNVYEYKYLTGKPIPAGAAPGSIKKSGKEMFEYIIDLSELKPSAKVLEVGCGMGRFTIPLHMKKYI